MKLIDLAAQHDFTLKTNSKGLHALRDNETGLELASPKESWTTKQVTDFLAGLNADWTVVDTWSEWVRVNYPPKYRSIVPSELGVNTPSGKE